MAAKKTDKGRLRVKLVRSQIGSNKYQRQVLAGLGLKKMNQVVEREDTPAIRGMVLKVLHLVSVEEVA